MFDGDKWYIKGSLTLVPYKGKAVAWSTHARKSELYPGVVYFSLILSDAHISVEKGVSGHPTYPNYPIHLSVHNYYEHSYLYPAMLIKNRKPRFHLEREKGKWWERLWGKLVLHTEIPYENAPYLVKNKTYPVEIPTHQVMENKHGKNPLWPVVEELIRRENEAEDLGIPEREIEEFVEQILFSKEGEEFYVPERLFLISPKAMVYKNREGKTLVREGDYGAWAIVNTGIRDGAKFSVYDSLSEKGQRVKSRIYRLKSQIYHLETNEGPLFGFTLFGAMRRVSNWTRVWNLALVPHEAKLDPDKVIQNWVLAVEGERASSGALSREFPEALVP
jgi:hypothetical protein